MAEKRSHTIIGYGALGRALVHEFLLRDLPVQSICSSRTEDVQHDLGNSAIPITSSIQDLKPGDVVWCTVPDDHIHSVCSQLKRYSKLENRYVVHCSGSLGLEVFGDIKDIESVQVASWHPLQTFSAQQQMGDESPFNKCFATILSSDSEIITFLKKLSQIMNIQAKEVDYKEKQRLHLSATIACNYLVTLMDIAENQSENTPLHMLRPLIYTTLDHIFESGTTESLSGPLKRGDISTIQTHLSHLDEEDRDLYLKLAKRTLNLTDHTNSSEIAGFIQSQLPESDRD